EIPVTAYGGAPSARQLGPYSIYANRLGARFYFSAARTVEGVTHLVSTHSVGVGLDINAPVSDTNPVVASAVRWYDFDVTSGTPVLLQQGTINPNPSTTDTFFPGIDIAPDGTIGVSYSQSGTNEYLSMYSTVNLPSDPDGFTRNGLLVKASE